MTNIILYEDPHLLVCKKPAGVPVQSRQLGMMDMESMLKNYLALSSGPEYQKASYLGMIHRLDQPVEGILVFAKSAKAAAKLSEQLTDGRMKKHYLAVVTSIPVKKQDTLTDYLLKDGKKNLSSVVSASTRGAKRSELSYQVLEEQDSLALLKIALKSGRHHQIRVQLAHAGYPLWGDAKYHPDVDAQKGKRQIALCAYRLEFYHPQTGKIMEFQIMPENAVFHQFSFVRGNETLDCH